MLPTAKYEKWGKFRRRCRSGGPKDRKFWRKRKGLTNWRKVRISVKMQMIGSTDYDLTQNLNGWQFCISLHSITKYTFIWNSNTKKLHSSSVNTFYWWIRKLVGAIKMKMIYNTKFTSQLCIKVTDQSETIWIKKKIRGPTNLSFTWISFTVLSNNIQYYIMTNTHIKSALLGKNTEYPLFSSMDFQFFFLILGGQKLTVTMYQ